MRSGGKKRPSILADALEAVIGAVYLDGGYGEAKGLVGRLYESIQISPVMAAIGKDSKTELQEWLQGHGYALPEYCVISDEGPPHRKKFLVGCVSQDAGINVSGKSSSRRKAEQAAALAALEHIATLSKIKGDRP